MSDTEKKPTLKSTLVKRVALLVMAGVVAMVLFLLNQHHNSDMKALSFEMHEKAALIRTGMLATMMATGDRDIVRKTVESYVAMSSVPFRLFESEYVQRQFGGHPDEMATDPIVIDVLEGRRDIYEELSGSTFRYIIPVISDERCQKCHEDLNGDPVLAGTRLGVMEFAFDVSVRRKESVKLISEMVLGIILFTGMMLFTMYRVFDASVLSPIRALTDDFAGLEREEFNITLPEQETEEIDILVKQVRKTAAALEEKKKEREKALEEEQKKIEQIRSFALKQAAPLGITDESEITYIIKRLSFAVKEVEKTEMVADISKYVTLESKQLVMKSDISLIRPAAFYLTELFACFDGSVKKSSIELALEEAITNAIVHGNLEVQSSLKEESFEEFDKQIRDRSMCAPYSERRVRISYGYGDGQARFTISDEGSGFEWRDYTASGEADQLELHGRGITIMRTFANTLEFNEKGNEVTLAFEMDIPSTVAQPMES